MAGSLNGAVYRRHAKATFLLYIPLHETFYAENVLSHIPSLSQKGQRVSKLLSWGYPLNIQPDVVVRGLKRQLPQLILLDAFFSFYFIFFSLLFLSTLNYLTGPSVGSFAQITSSHGVKPLRVQTFCTLSFMPEFIAKTQNPIVLNFRYEEFATPS